MDKALWDKLAAAGGVVGALLFVVAIVVLGTPPSLDDEASTVAGFFVENRGQVLWALWFQGLGVLAVVWFVAALGAAMRNAGEGRLAAALGFSFALTFAFGGVAALIRGGLGFRIAEEADAGLTTALYHLSLYMDSVTSVVGAGMYAAVAGAALRTRFLPAWWAWLSGLAALWGVVSATAWGREGFWSPEGAGLVGFVVFLVWVGFTSVLLVLQMRGSEAHQPAAAV
ncbi:MAG TPA: hypothetical protein VNJ53_11020 [Gaiellaceae bacterium]|nr:hypothetical protein [Gaiellaceae bacterium]